MIEIQESTLTYTGKKHVVASGEVAYVKDADGKLLGIATEGTTIITPREYKLFVGTAAEVSVAAKALPLSPGISIDVAKAVIAPVKVIPTVK